jgi:hypothetical protein
MSSHAALNELRRWLSAAGEEPDPRELGGRLGAVWHLFRGGRAEGMNAGKLRRIESPRWSPPILEFKIERHGGTVLGSSRAELQRWTLDLEDLTASCSRGGHRQLRSMQARLDVAPVAAEVAALVERGAKDPRLKWDGETVTVIVSSIAELKPGSAVSRTLKGRRERFRDKLLPAMAALGYGLDTWTSTRGRLRFLRRPPEPGSAEPTPPARPG